MCKIELQHICKSYFVSEKETAVLRDLSAVLDTERRITVLGESGCGKTTLLRILAGLTAADAGKCVLPEGLRIGYVFQEDRLFPWMTAEENVAAVVSGNQLRKREAEKLLRLVGLQDFAAAYPRELSGGMRKKVAFARCLAFRPDWIIMDEPFSALDYFERNRLQNELLAILRQQNKGFLLVTHDVDEALKLSQEIRIMKSGQLTKCFEIPDFHTADLFDSPELIRLKKEILHEYHTQN